MPVSDSEAPPRADPPGGRKLGETVLEDLVRDDTPGDLRRDLRDVYRFYLDDETRRELDGMNDVERGIFLVSWFVKNSVLKLPPARRLVLLAGCVAFLFGTLIAPSTFAVAAGFGLVLLVLLAELKDKLLAQDELRTGRAVQLALMPRRHPTLAGWEIWLHTRPANDVGGDLVDYQAMGDGRLGLTLGDVAGKGLGAALVMANLQATLRALAPRLDALDTLAAEANEILVRDGVPARFVSLVYLLLGPDEGAARLVNAGHLPPLHVHDGHVTELPRGGAALGLTDAATYAEQQVTLAPGDLLVIYSDGLTEARDEDEAFFSDERLHALLGRLHDRPIDTLGRMLLRAVDRFAGEAPPSDDLSLILLRRTG